MNTTIFYEAKADSFSGMVDPGVLQLGDLGVVFSFKNKHREPLFFEWKLIKQAEANVSFSGKISKEFALVLTSGLKMRFASKDSGAILKQLGEMIGPQNIVRAPNLLNALFRPFKP